MRLVNYKQNEKMLQEVPHFRYHDLAIIFYCLLHANKENNAHILIHNSHLDIWKISKEALYQVAKKNTPKLLPHQLMPLTEVLLQSHYICDEDIEKMIRKFISSQTVTVPTVRLLYYTKNFSRKLRILSKRTSSFCRAVFMKY